MRIKPSYNLALVVGLLTVLIAVTVGFAMPNSAVKVVIVVGVILLGVIVEWRIERASRNTANAAR